MKRKSILLIFLLLATLLPILAPAAGSVQLKLVKPRGKSSIQVGDIFYIEYVVSNIDSRASKPASVPGAHINYFDLTGQSSSVVQSGTHIERSTQLTYTLTLRAEKEGTFSFGPVAVGNVKSNTLKYTIGGPSSGQPSQSAQSLSQNSSSSGDPKYIGKGDGNLFLKASVSKTTAYEQEALVYTVKLYCSYSRVKFIGATAAPKFQGFVVEESKNISNQLTYETYNGRTYATAVIARYIIFPQMSGALKVLGNTYTISVDEHEYYQDPFWGQMSYSTPLQLNVTPNDLTINVRPLPQPQPADFSGGVGHFSISSSLPSAQLKTNEAASVIYTVKGEGNLKYVKLPELNLLFPQALEVYSPETKVQTQVNATNVSGTVTFDYSMMPQATGSYDIPEVKLVYFNPETGQYETASARGYKVQVGKGESSSKSQTKGLHSFNPQLLSSHGSPRSSSKPVATAVWYWIIYVVLIAALCGSIFGHQYYLKMNSDIVAVKSRKANREARRRLRKAAACMKRNDYEHFFDEIIAALWGYIGDKLKMSVSELNRENASQKLETAGIDSQITKELIVLIDRCEFYKYAPAAADGNMRQIYDDASSVINSLNSSFKTSQPQKK